MLDYLYQFLLFLAEAITLVAAVGAIVVIAVAATRKDAGHGESLRVRDLGERFQSMKRALEQSVLPAKTFKAQEKARKKAEKARAKRETAPGERVFVLDFKGDIRASAVESLREEVTAILLAATDRDRVVVRLENSGGLVNEHGLAASQLLRLRQRGLDLTVCVDKVAASGGYMMACVANRILAAPFAVLGSIGVLAQIPNFHRLLDQHGVDFEQIKGGEHKRTVTMFGENTEADRAKLQEEIEDVHALFKTFVAENRADLDLARVATGEHWLGQRALDLGLCDALSTSDDFLLEASGSAALYHVTYQRRKRLGTKLAESVAGLVEAALDRWWSGGRSRSMTT